MSLKRISTLLIIFALGVVLSSCSQLGYYTQAAKGQWEIMSKRTPISKALLDPEQSEQVKEKLRLINVIRKFAVDHLDLPDNKSYTYYADLQRRHVVWNVVATPAYSIAPKTWCFPITGCVAYKGYFNESDARTLNDKLHSQGLDTYLYGVSAYSTLGWFSDPILNTFLTYDEIYLAGLIFHELSHQVVFIKDDSEFNEAFATAVEYAGIEAWLNVHGTPEQIASFKLTNENQMRITELIIQYRKQLSEAYGAASESELKNTKQQLFAEMKQAYQQLSDQGKGTRFYDWWFGLDLNNAHLSTVATYHRLVPAFSQVLSETNSYTEFYNLIAEKGALEKTERNKWLNQYLPRQYLPAQYLPE